MSGADYRVAQASLVGDRKENQDRCVVLERDDTVILVLGDGLGGHPRGELAAQTLVDCAHEQFQRHNKIANAKAFIEDCVTQAHRQIVQYGDAQEPPISPRSTAVIALIIGGKAYWGHVGDSRLYLLRNGQVQSVTEDHAQDSADGSIRGGLTRCIGGPSVSPQISWGRPDWLQPGDTLLLCSDGFWNQLDTRHVAPILCNSDELNADLGDLAGEAVRAGDGRSDNVTAVALQWLTENTNIPANDPDQVDAAIEHLQQVIKRFSN